MRTVLHHAAHVRSGDKGNTANVGVFAYAPGLYPILVDQLTADAFRAFYTGLVLGDVERYEVPAIHALNFVAHGALGGGVSRSLNLDNYGKALCSAILAFPLEVPDELVPELRGLPDAATGG
jgi:hypothetical protein